MKSDTDLIGSTVRIRDGTGTGYRPVRSGPVRSGTGLDFGPAGLPVDRSLPVDRPVAGRPVGYRYTGRVLTLKFCFFHVKIHKTSVGSQEYLSDNI